MASLPPAIITLLLAATAAAADVKTPTPLMGWNSYNHYSCSPSEAIIKANAAGLVALGLDRAGYEYVTPDCGWNADYRDAAGRLVWDPTTFPSGGAALGDYIHGLGLRFGVYSGAGYYMCDSTDEPASLGHEATDAASFVSWGADALKYDNCYSVSNTTMVDYTSPGTVSPTRYQTMAGVLTNVSRDVVFQVCQWGVGTDIGEWAPPIADSWRISNDIQDNWQSIWRITNQVVPYYRYTRVGAYPDMDMLIVGLGCLSHEEERFHFGMWAINKSPLVIGAPMNVSLTPAESLAILGNAEVIALNKDPLARQARLVRRYTEAGWDLWAGELSSSSSAGAGAGAGRMVVGLANWNNASTPVSVDLAAALGVSAALARDVWAARDIGLLAGTYETSLKAHELRLLVLSAIVPAPRALVPAPTGHYYAAAVNATLRGAATLMTCPPGTCLPVGAKVTGIGPGPGSASVTFHNVVVRSSEKKPLQLLGIDYANYDVALDSAWTNGTNTRNLTVAVNGGRAQRWAFPIAGGDWNQTGRLMVEVEGFSSSGGNEVVFAAYGEGEMGVDLVGFEVFE